MLLAVVVVVVVVGAAAAFKFLCDWLVVGRFDVVMKNLPISAQFRFFSGGIFFTVRLGHTLLSLSQIDHVTCCD